jgi:hypothetical protein
MGNRLGRVQQRHAGAPTREGKARTRIATVSNAIHQRGKSALKAGLKQEKEMEEDKSHAETPKEFLHRELGELASRCVLRGVPVGTFGSVLLGCAIHAIIEKEGKEKANQIVASLTQRYFDMEPQVKAFMGKGGTA